MDVQFTRNMIIRHEGWRLRCYTDTAGVPTIGVGYNLLQPSTKADLAYAMAPPSTLLRAHMAVLTNNMVSTLLDITFQRAQQAASVAARSFSVLPDPVQAVLVDMQFNLGPTRAAHFVRFWAAIDEHNWRGAAQQLWASEWREQNPNRVADLMKLLQNTPPTLQGETNGSHQIVLQ